MVVVELVESGGPDEKVAEHTDATVVASEEAAHLLGLDGLGSLDELLEGGRGRQLGLLQG